MAHDNGRRRVLMVMESNYPTIGGGGAEGQLRTICRYLNERRIPVSIIVPMRADGIPREHDEVDGVRVWRIRYPKIRLFGGAVLMAKLVTALIRRRREYDVIHAHMAANMAAGACVVGRLLGKRVIVKITGSLELDQGVLDPAQRGLFVSIKRWMFRCASFFQATSTEIRDRLLATGIPVDRVRVIPNAVDVARFSTDIETRMHDSPVMTAVCVGRLSEEKAPDVLIEAWMRAFPPDAPVRLMLIGHGRMRKALLQRIADTKREAQIELLGPQSDVAPFLAKADVAVLPSLYEGLSNAMLEYMAAGLPVLGTRVSGTVDFVDHGRNGWLVDAGDEEQLAAQLKVALGTDRATLRAMGEAARQRVEARARIDAVMRQLAELYEINADLLKPVPQNKPI